MYDNPARVAGNLVGDCELMSWDAACFQLAHSRGSDSMARQFEDHAWWDERKRRLCFEIDHEGQRISCCVDATCLFLAFGAKTLAEGDARDCFSANRRRIRELAIALAQKRAVRDSYLE